ncbi:dienelactone hydrolase [Inhella inkyongensis]|uniref:Dienelactone hydrolase n=1 Tax=Inhella inkyongensis TaxID=392593 RepID=A0A840S5R3_9BURK|nr:dienelactone hydrolase family protein [Inhella inkyongensis]MBB5205043.1 dienelactone hydrolase [Inhella inkyongensis]
MALLALVLLAQVPPAQADPPISQPAGPHAVGLRVIQPAAPREAGLPAQVLIWYPADTSVSDAPPLRYGDLMATRLSALRTDLSATQLREGRAQQQASLMRRLGVSGQAVLDAPLQARSQAVPAPGRFPLVVYAAGVGGPADENADLFEYLASHGYVVVSSVGMGADGREVEETLAHVEPQVATLQALIRQAPQWTAADPQRVAVMGWSWGGMSNLFAAARDPQIGAIISLDGTREPALTRQIDVQRLTAPWLYVSRSPDTIAQIQRSGIDTTFSLLNAAQYAEVTQLIVYPMQHADFVSRRMREASDAGYGEYSRAEVRQAFGMVALYVRHFLDAHLRQQASSLEFLARKPVANGAVPHSLRIDIRPPAKP